MKKTRAEQDYLVAEGWLKPAKVRKVKKPRIVEMRRWPHANGFICSNCGWPLHYERIEHRNEFFCRPECALQKYREKGRVRVLSACADPGADKRGNLQTTTNGNVGRGDKG